METMISRSAGRARIAIRTRTGLKIACRSAALALVGLADAFGALEPGGAGRIAGRGGAGGARLHLAVRLAHAVVAFLSAGAGRRADPGAGVLGVRLAHAVVALLARAA